MTDHLLAALAGLAMAIVAALMAAVAARVQLLPDVIDLTVIPTGAGLMSMLFAFIGALRRFEPDRLARVSLAGTLLGAAVTTLVLLIAVLIDVLS